MAQNVRARLMRMPRQEHEIHVIDNRLEQLENSFNSTRKAASSLNDYDYQAPLTANSLRPNSRWIFVRQNLHRIRAMGPGGANTGSSVSDFYLVFQMVRELRRAQEAIMNADKQDDFQVIKKFEMGGGRGRKKYNISHVKPEDALIYDRLGEEPLVLRNLLYYFDKQDVKQGTVFWDFLSAVNEALHLRRKRTVLVQRLRRIALTLAIICYCIIGLMFFLMIISVITTASRMNDPEVLWFKQQLELSSLTET